MKKYLVFFGLVLMPFICHASSFEPVDILTDASGNIVIENAQITDLTASSPVETNGDKVLQSGTKTGSGSQYVMDSSPTIKAPTLLGATSATTVSVSGNLTTSNVTASRAVYTNVMNQLSASATDASRLAYLSATTGTTPGSGYGKLVLDVSPVMNTVTMAGTTSTGPLNASGNISAVGDVSSNTGNFSGQVATNTILNSGLLTTGSMYSSGNVSAVGDVSSATTHSTSLTSGRVPIVSTAGLLVDDSDLTFSGSTLTVTDVSATTTWGSAMTGTAGAVRQLNATITTPTINSPQLTGASANTLTATDVSSSTLWGFSPTGTGAAVRQVSPTLTSPALTGASANTIVGTDSSFNTLWGSAMTGTGGAVRQLNATITTPTINSPQLTGASANTLSVVTLTATDASMTTTWGSSPTGTSGAVRQLNATLTTPTINSPQLTGASANTLSVVTLTATDASATTLWGFSPSGTGAAIRQNSPTLNSAQLTNASANVLTGTTIAVTGDVSANSFHVNAGGIYFPLSGANPLDDYEEGTWTPVYQGAGGSVGDTSYTTQVGTYTKIGNRILLEGKVVLSNNGSWSGAVSIGGLPFTPTINAAGSVFSTQTTYDGHIFASIGAGSASIGMTIQKSATNFADLDCGNVTDTGYFTFSAVYY